MIGWPTEGKLMLSGRTGEEGNSSLPEEGAYPSLYKSARGLQAAPWIGGRGLKGLRWELALEGASNLQGLEEEIENGNSVQQYEQQSLLKTLLFKNISRALSRLSGHLQCRNCFN